MIPKTFKELSNHPLVRGISYEPNTDGSTIYWVYLIRGYYGDDYGLHTIAANTIKDIKDVLTTAQVCDCESCKD